MNFKLKKLQEEKEGIMIKIKATAFVKISGNLVEKEEVLDWLRERAQQYYVAVCVGGGEQINEAFRKKGFEINFGPFGRIVKSLEEKQLARDVLEINQARLQDLLDERGINARVLIPVWNVATVLSPLDGDVFVLGAHNGYDKVYVLTLKSREEEKRELFKRVAECFSNERRKGPCKIKVIGF